MFPGHGHGGYQQPQWQQGFNQGFQRTGPPPAKKPKSNPIITRYPPPPGYRGPAQPQPPYQYQAQPPYPQQPQPPFQQHQQPQFPHQQGHHAAYQQLPPQGAAYSQQPQAAYQPQPVWQQPGQVYHHGLPSYNNYTAQAYQSTQPYQQSQYPSSQPQNYQPNGYPAQTYSQPPQGFLGPAPSGWQGPTPAPHAGSPPHWSPASTVPQKRQHSSSNCPKGQYGSGGLLDGNGDPLPPPVSESEDLEDDYDGECYFARHPDEINPDLSLKTIEWRAALPTKRALPATFAEAELEALAPRKPLPADEESVSEYFIKAKRDEAFLSVRQTDYWNTVKDDLVFCEFAFKGANILSMSETLDKYKDRSDSTWSARAQSSTPEPESSSMKGEPRSDAGVLDTHMEEYPERNGHFKSEDDSEQADVLGNLEQALQQSSASYVGSHSRASSTASITSQKITRPTPVMPVRDQAQEDILAALGVTGSPKMVYQTPGPAFGARVSQDGGNGSVGGGQIVANNLNGLRVAPPPPPPPGHPPPSYQTWRAKGHVEPNGYSDSRRSSSGSQHTVTGSDFQGEDQDATPRPKRKRDYEDSEDGAADDRQHEQDDDTPKQRRKYPHVEAAYSRRW